MREYTNECPFIGPTIYKSINLGGSPRWKSIWENILDVYANRCTKTSNKPRFYWDLTTRLGKMLIDRRLYYFDLPKKISLQFETTSSRDVARLMTIDKYLRDNYELLLKTFIRLSLETLTASFDDYREGVAFDATAAERAIDDSFAKMDVSLKYLLEKIYARTQAGSEYFEDAEGKRDVTLFRERLNGDIEDLFETLFRLFRDSDRDSNVDLLPDDMIEAWNHVGPVYWLWFHLTAGKLTYAASPATESVFKEFFNNVDVFISCWSCSQHFVLMRNSETFQTLKRTLPTDLFLINVHELIRRRHHREREADADYIDAGVLSMDLDLYCRTLRDEYKNWWE